MLEVAARLRAAKSLARDWSMGLCVGTNGLAFCERWRGCPLLDCMEDYKKFHMLQNKKKCAKVKIKTVY